MIHTHESTVSELMALAPYGASLSHKNERLLEGLGQLCRHHYENCTPYARIVDGLWGGPRRYASIAEIPYLPVSLFKSQALMSVPSESVAVTLTSSGTTGQTVSKIYVDAKTSTLQQRALANSLGHVLGAKRLPMLVIDSSAVFRDPRLMSARGAGVLGIMRYGRSHVFALDDDARCDLQSIKSFLEAFGSSPFLMFGFTYLVWLEFYLKLRAEGLDLSRGILIHSGGWKKMAERAVTPDRFRTALAEDFRLTQVFNFYGMVEQIGTIHLEGEGGLLYPPNFADVLIRNPRTGEVCPDGAPGVVQVLSLLPGSYPGHSLLTEDVGVIEPAQKLTEGFRGKGFRVLGRVAKTELRGCSDVIASQR